MDAARPSAGGAGPPMRVLVVHPDPAARRRAGRELSPPAWRVAAAADAGAAVRALAGGAFDLVVADPGLLAACGLAGDGGRAEGGPLLLALVAPGDAPAALAALAAGADDVCASPWAPGELGLRARACVARLGAAAARDEAALRRAAEAVARGGPLERVLDAIAEQAARAHGAEAAAVARLGPAGPVPAGRWRSGPGARPAGGPDGVLGQRGDRAAPVAVDGRVWGAVVLAGARRGTEAPLERFADLAALAVANAAARDDLTARAVTDPLTGLANRRAFEERLQEEVGRARRHGRDLALVVLDLDHFKAVNDAHGHVAGDAVLREAAWGLAARAREADVVARLGGEEFAWLMPETDGMEAWQAADRARAALAGTPFPGVGRVTLSAGVCELGEDGDPDDLYRRADVALFWAKRHGRDVVFLYSPEIMEAPGAEAAEAQLRRRQSFQSIRVLARAVDAKDPSTRRHSERVAGLAASLAEALGWEAARVALVHEAALVHDVGKIAVPDAVLFTPRRLTPPERERVRTHAALGAEMLSDVLTPEQAAWVRAHHERWDGRGYPDRLAGEAVPEGARILHVADAWDVMTSSRPYVRPLSPAEALAECRRQSGRQFAPAVVEALGALWDSGILAAGALERPAADPA